MSDKVLVVGATSGIARALCYLMAQQGHALVLAGRDKDELSRMAGDLEIRYAVSAQSEVFEARDFDGHEAFFQRCVECLDGELTGVVVCHGYLPDQERTQVEFSDVRKTMEVNYLSAVSLLDRAATYFERRKSGYIVAVSSVAGDRGRQSNYTYGASKAAVSVYLSGLRNRLFHAGVSVITVKPGFVDTPMTQGLIDPRSPLVASPERVARGIFRAIQKRKDAVYVPWFWRAIMTVICLIPEFVFKRLKL